MQNSGWNKHCKVHITRPRSVCILKKHEKLKGQCKKSLAERSSCLETFSKLCEHVDTCLEAMVNSHVYSEVNESRWNQDSNTKTTAHGSKSNLQSFGVIVRFKVLKNSLDYLKGLSPKLQRRDNDVFEAQTMIDNIKLEIQSLRDDIGVEFQRWYDELKQLASYIRTKEEMPRIPMVQCNRSSVPTDREKSVSE